MSDDFEDHLKRWLRDRGTVDRSTVEALAGNVAALPPRRRRQPSQLSAAAVIIVAIGLAAFALAPRFNSGTGAASPVPPDPAAFAGDPRLARCGATVDTAIDAFEMAHARDYRRHLPAMGLAPELDVDTPAFVVVYRGMQPFPGLGGAPPPGQTWPTRSLEPGRHDICVLVGAGAATAEMTLYSDVDTSGLTAAIQSPRPNATEPPGSEPPGSQSPGTEPSTTPIPLEPYGPADFWAGVTPGGNNVEHFDRLDDMTKSSDVVVIGTVTRISQNPARHVDLSPSDGAFAQLDFTVEQVVSGIPEYASPGVLNLEFFMTDPREFDRFAAQVPTEHVLVFLRNKAVEAQQFGWPPEGPETGHLYYRVVSDQGIIRNVDGTAVATDDGIRSLGQENKKSFDQVVAEARAAAR